jgi:hypothetical protein
MSDGVHAAVNAEQPTPLRPHPDGARAQSQLDQVTVRHNSVLPPGERGKPLLDGGLVRLIPHIGTK